MNYTHIAMVYTAVQTALLATIRYWLYQDNLRVPAKRMYAYVLAFSLGSTSLWVATGGVPNVSFGIYRALLAAFMFAVSCFIIKERFSKHAFVYSFIMVYDTVIEYTATFIQYRVSPGDRGVVFVAVAAVLLGATFIPAARNLKKMIQRLSVPGHDKLWGYLSIIGFSFVFMNLLFTYPIKDEPTVRDLISRYLMLIGIGALYAATTRALETMSDAANAREELSNAKIRVAMQERYYSRLASQMHEVRRMKHDMRHHRAVLASIIKSGDSEALARYAEPFPENEEFVPVTGNLAADSMLLFYSDMAKKHGVNIETELAISRGLPIADQDLCVILGNLLENAVEAQEYVAPEKRFIRVSARSDENGLTLAVDNRFDGTLNVSQDGSYVSRKSERGHGIGVDSVRIICEKYGGIFRIETDGDVFMAGIVIGI